ncbi:uncharacterized protein trdc [Salminus brasiliensis]|uniref:uncharacterized protein trdc n=1 Tax=Salminus brasiliensis TaxID=930266 RepID=UPI003B8310AF
MCLAAGFYPKNGKMILTLPNGNTVPYDVNNSVLSKGSTYYFAGYSTESIEKCQLQGEEAVPISKINGAKSNKTEAPSKCDPPSNSINQTNVIKPFGDPKGNAMSLLVTGLRLLLAKAVAVNVMMTIKAFLV